MVCANGCQGTPGTCFPRPVHTPELFYAAVLPALPAATGGAAGALLCGGKAA